MHEDINCESFVDQEEVCRINHKSLFSYVIVDQRRISVHLTFELVVKKRLRRIGKLFLKKRDGVGLSVITEGHLDEGLKDKSSYRFILCYHIIKALKQCVYTTYITGQNGDYNLKLWVRFVRQDVRVYCDIPDVFAFKLVGWGIDMK